MACREKSYSVFPNTCATDSASHRQKMAQDKFFLLNPLLCLRADQGERMGSRKPIHPRRYMKRRGPNFFCISWYNQGVRDGAGFAVTRKQFSIKCTHSYKINPERESHVDFSGAHIMYIQQRRREADLFPRDHFLSERRSIAAWKRDSSSVHCAALFYCDLGQRDRSASAG